MIEAEPKSELEIARAQLVEAQQMASIGRLLAGVMHEIKTPIGSILCNNEVILRSLEKLKQLLENGQADALEKARAIVGNCRDLASVDKIACERITSVIRSLKTVARADNSERSRVDLNENLRSMLKLTQAEFCGRVTIETDFGELPEVEGYPQLLNQVLLNLLVNAGQAIQGEGKITVRTRREGDWVQVAISDTGCGMTPEQQKKVFSSGFTTKPVGEGTGLGLTTARKIVEDKHGGTIGFESSPGAGTTFRIRIPIRPIRPAREVHEQ
jgi:two-component system, NtrC family, sensor kinase